MVGGYTIIPIRGTSNEKTSIGTSAVNLKAGTYAKVERAIKLQKPIMLTDIIVGQLGASPAGLMSFSGKNFLPTPTGYAFEFKYFNDQGSNVITLNILLNSNDTILYKSFV